MLLPLGAGWPCVGGFAEEEAAALALCLELGRLRPLSELAVIDELTWAFRLLLRRLA